MRQPHKTEIVGLRATNEMWVGSTAASTPNLIATIRGKPDCRYLHFRSELDRLRYMLHGAELRASGVPPPWAESNPDANPCDPSEEGA